MKLTTRENPERRRGRLVRERRGGLPSIYTQTGGGDQLAKIDQRLREVREENTYGRRSKGREW
jgi:hypothetical protein